ncbi:putative ob-fold nucleic acid binding domain-containing protein [Golovinomyces cichoracearum]|uniref:Putative ob-fold nucleic acid binding domain-containing protein n=1 Tax=Golovinomyces cichoracearum TaxID=62708 RepID=A0A420JB60_9PEZI|nr:putative ob-fold nucleic acid binding domain-containing protein [Golovinomyces cichoracearum]
MGNGSNYKKIYTLDDSSGSCIECSAISPAANTPSVEGSTLTTQFSKQNMNKNLACERKIDEKNHDAEERRHVKQNKIVRQERQVQAAGPSVLIPSVPWNEVDIGTVAKIKGRVAIWWDRRRIEIVKVEVLKCTDLEVKCWNEVREFRKEILDIPWSLTRNEELQCRSFKERQMRKSSKDNEKKRSQRRKQVRMEK